MDSRTQQLRVRRYLWRLVEVVALMVFLVLLFVLFAWSMQYILPFVIGWFVAFLLLPLVRSLERRGVGRMPAVVTVMGGIGLIVLVISIYSVVAMAREATLLSLNLKGYFSQIDLWVRHQINAGQDLFGDLPPKVAVGIQKTATGVLNSFESTFKGFATAVLHTLTHLPESLFVIVIAVIAAFFVLVNREQMYQGFLRALPPGWSGKVQVVTRDVMRAFIGTIRVQVLLMLLSAVLGVIGMWIIGVPYAVILGLLFGLSGMVPIFGSAILTVPWAAGALLLGDVSLALKLLLLQAVISLIRHMVEPKILADNVGLDMLSTLFGLYAGMKVLGVIGLFLGPIILIGVKSLFRARMFVDFLPSVDHAAAYDVDEAVAGTARQAPDETSSHVADSALKRDSDPEDDVPQTGRQGDGSTE